MTKQIQTQHDSPECPAIEITPEMIEAGVYAARAHTLGEPLQELVSKVFISMQVEQDLLR